MRRPTTLREWQTHIDALEGERLLQEARGANTVRFVRVLQGEGYAAADIHAILILMAKRVAQVGPTPPGGLYDYAALAAEPTPAT